MKHLIISIDLSFKSTGMTIAKLNNNIAEEISFYRVLFDKELSLHNKEYSPKSIKNVNDFIYRMPHYILVNDLVINEDDENNVEQCETTLKAIFCSSAIKKIIDKHCKINDYDFVVFCIENYIMPDFGGKNQLKSVSGLIMLQGFVREHIIKEYGNSKKIKLLTPTPSTIKSFFAKNGRADKSLMIKSFIENYDGKKLIPDIEKLTIPSINDVVDSFAMAMYSYHKLINNDIHTIEVL